MLALKRSALRQAASAILPRGCRKYSDYPIKKDYQPLMNELPVPYGSWQDNYDRLQKRNNAVLFFGFVFFLSSVTFLQTNGFYRYHTGPDFKKFVYPKNE